MLDQSIFDVITNPDGRQCEDLKEPVKHRFADRLQ